MVHQAPQDITREERFFSLIPHFTVEKTGYFCCCLWLWKSPVIIPAAVASITEPRALAYPRGPAPEAERDWISLRQILAPGRMWSPPAPAPHPQSSSVSVSLVSSRTLTLFCFLSSHPDPVAHCPGWLGEDCPPPCSILSLQHLARPSHLPMNNILHHLRSL